jgi:hypothetical protein
MGLNHTLYFCVFIVLKSYKKASMICAKALFL